MRISRALIVSLFLLPSALSAADDTAIVPTECLVLPPSGHGGRVAIPTDAVWEQLASGKWKAPAAGDKLTGADGKEIAWQALKAEKPGSFKHDAFAGGYAFINVPSERDQVLMLEASGHRLVFVNGEPRVGDVYQHGYVRIPIALKKGDNELLFQCL